MPHAKTKKPCSEREAPAEAAIINEIVDLLGLEMSPSAC
jgi:hypothetical protein